MESLVVRRSISLRQQALEEAIRIASHFRLSEVASRILAARGFSADSILKQFITPSLKEGLPLPEALRGIKEACAIIAEAQKNGEKIAICCDFDCDGLTSGAQLSDFFNRVGISYKLFVPDRFVDGYGLNQRIVEEAKNSDCSVIVTLDFGTKSYEEIKRARELGLKTVIIDHHNTDEGHADADVFVNPHHSECGFADRILSASGLTWYFIVALRNHFPNCRHIDPKEFLDLAAIGTICDMVPLRGANRVLAKRGLELLSQTRRPGLIALKSVAGIKADVKCSDVSFGIGPRINAAGRIVHGDLVIELLTTANERRARDLAQKLNRLNAERQEEETKVKDRAVRQIVGKGEIPWGLVAADVNFHTGVIGIVAQRLVEMFYRPAAVLGSDIEGKFKGSVRGIPGFNVVEALASVKDTLLQFGGHTGAGGFSVAHDNYENFKAAFEKECERRLESLQLKPSVEADTEVGLGEIDVNLINELKFFSPCGIGNANPVLLTENLKVVDVKEIREAHLKVTFTDGRRYLNGIMWRQKSHPDIKKGGSVRVAYRPEVNSYGGVTELQANIQAVEAS